MSENNALAAPSAVPSHLQQYLANPGQRPAGLEEYRSQDVQVPRIALMQALSPEVTAGLFKPGDIINSLTKELIAEGPRPNVQMPPVNLVVVKHFIQWIEWKPRSEGGGMIASSSDHQSELAVRCARGEKVNDSGREVPAITEYQNFLVLLPDTAFSYPFMLCLARTNFKHGKNLLTRVIMRGPGLPAWAGMYRMTTTQETNSRNQKYFVFNFASGDWASPEVCDQANKLHQTFAGRSIVTNHETQEEVVASEGESNESAF